MRPDISRWKQSSPSTGSPVIVTSCWTNITIQTSQMHLGYHTPAHLITHEEISCSPLSKSLVSCPNESSSLLLLLMTSLVDFHWADDDAYLYTLGETFRFGIIQLQLWRLRVNNVLARQPLVHQYGGQVLESQVLHERSKKAGAHHVKCVPPTCLD